MMRSTAFESLVDRLRENRGLAAKADITAVALRLGL